MKIGEVVDAWETIKHHTYKIEKGDTLDSVALQLGKKREHFKNLP